MAVISVNCVIESGYSSQVISQKYAHPQKYGHPLIVARLYSMPKYAHPLEPPPKKVIFECSLIPRVLPCNFFFCRGGTWVRVYIQSMAENIKTSNSSETTPSAFKQPHTQAPSLQKKRNLGMRLFLNMRRLSGKHICTLYCRLSVNQTLITFP